MKGVLSDKKIVNFVDYFVGLNGIPREKKIAEHVPKKKYEYVLKKYESIIEVKLKSASLIPGVKGFIERLSRLNKNMIVLSGGTETEVIQLLTDRGLINNFDGRQPAFVKSERR